jgi:hypothetical protein
MGDRAGDHAGGSRRRPPVGAALVDAGHADLHEQRLSLQAVGKALEAVAVLFGLFLVVPAVCGL